MLYAAAIPYPGKMIVENGKTTFEGILSKRSDNVAFLDAFTKAEDDLLDWSEDIREVEFFFNNRLADGSASIPLTQEYQNGIL